MKKYFLLVLLLFSINIYSQTIDEKNILVLHSYHKGLSWTENIISGIQFVFNDKIINSYNIKISYEYMDTKRFEEPEYYEMLAKIYSHKSKKNKYDLIISVDDNALVFLQKYRDSIFGNVPVVFCGVNYYKEGMFSDFKNYTGVVEAFAAKETIDLALKLHPNTKEFVVVGDNTITSQNNNKVIENVSKDYIKDGIQFKYYTSGNLYEYKRELQKLTEGSIVLALLFNKDNTGKFYTYEESFAIYSALVKVPIYTYWDFYLGYGAVGGKIISGFAQGEEAAKIALRVLDRESIEKIPVQTESPNRYIFDYNIIQKFGLSKSSLPKESKIINSPVSIVELYHHYREYILGILVLIIFLVIVILILSFNIKKRISMEKKLVETNKAYFRFVPRQLLDHLNKDDILDVKLGDCINKEFTVLFSDIRSFTTISEGMTPEENFRFINSYLKAISPVIRDHKGFIDKFIGDAIMALFPYETQSAIDAAIEMQKSLFTFNEKRKLEGFETIAIGIGLHKGHLMLGTVGEEMRMEGTVISDAVNLSSRLEGLTKTYGAKTILSEPTLDSLGEVSKLYSFRFLGSASVKGKKKLVKIYELLDSEIANIREKKIQTRDDFEKGVCLFEEKNYIEAKLHFEKVLALNLDDQAAKYYMESMKNFH